MQRVTAALTAMLFLLGVGWLFSIEPTTRAYQGKIIRGDGPAVEDQLIVRMNPVASPVDRAQALTNAGVRVIRDFSAIVPGLLQVELPKGELPDTAIEVLDAHPAVQYVERNQIYSINATPNDPNFSSLYGLNNTGQTGGVSDADIDAPEAWNTTVGSDDVVVGVVDTGIDYNHQDLQANMWVNTGEIPGNGVDDDANGYIDDIYGWNAIANNGNPFDDNNHGTHVSGTIGARGNNGVGVVGVNWKVKLMALKFLGANGSGSTADAIECINYAVTMRNKGTNIRVLSNSWGGGGFSQSLLDAINAANSVGLLFVAAAGNSSSNNDSIPNYPSNYNAPNVVAVASTTSTDALSPFSSFGATTVDLGAPGSLIRSTTPNNTYSTFSGTSMATPHVAGVAALLLSINSTLTVAEMKNALLQGTDPKPSLTGKCVSGGRLNAAKAVMLIGSAQPDFTMSANPANRTINQGQATDYTISTTPLAGFTGAITMNVTSSPAMSGATFSFSPNPVNVGDNVTLIVTTAVSTAVGTYTLAIRGTNGTKQRLIEISLTIFPQGTTTSTFDNNSVTPIPDNNSTGIISVIDVSPGQKILSLNVTVDVTHPYIGDLIISLIAPTGSSVVLHNRQGGSSDDLHQTFELSTFNNQNSAGQWKLKVTDVGPDDIGTLDHWRLAITGTPISSNNVPTVNITSPASNLTFVQGTTINFAGNASDIEDGNLTANLVWTSSLNGQIGTGGSFSKNNLSVGTHTITAKATDSGSAIGQKSITLTIAGASATVTVTSITPNTTAVGRVASITITGSGFAPGATVLFSGNNGTNAPPRASSIVVVNSTKITAVVTPARTQSAARLFWDVTVRNPNGSTGKLANGFSTTQ
ncbi:MAG: S8 family serine peptidase [Acidobacteriota bacterium]